MKPFKYSVLTFVALICLLTVSTAFAQGTAFTYQGRLNTVGGAASGSYDLTFTVYGSTNLLDTSVAGPLTNSAVAVSNGLFTVTLDFGGGVFSGDPRWLEIGVRTNGNGTFSTLSPRQALLPAPYAIAAGNLIGSLPAAQLSGVYTNGVTFNNPSNSFAGNGGGLTNLNTVVNGLATTNYVNAITNGLATTNYVNTATNNFGNSVAVVMTNAANQFTGIHTNSTYYGNGIGLTNIPTSGVNNFLGSVTNVVINQSYVTATIMNGLATTNYVNAITNGLATTNYVKTYSDTNGAALAASDKQTNMLFVEVTGNDATGQRNNRALPFATIPAACAASQLGDVIKVGAGVFPTTNAIMKPFTQIRGISHATFIEGDGVDEGLNSSIYLTNGCTLADFDSTIGCVMGTFASANITNLFFENLHIDTPLAADVIADWGGYISNSVVQNCYLRSGWDVAMQFENSAIIDSTLVVSDVYNDTTTHCLEGDNLTLRNVTLANYGNTTPESLAFCALSFSGAPITLDNCVLIHPGGTNTFGLSQFSSVTGTYRDNGTNVCLQPLVAQSFVGNGAGLTNLNPGGNIITNNATGVILSGTFTNGTYYGNGGGLTNLTIPTTNNLVATNDTTWFARKGALSVMFTPANPTTTTSNTYVMMGLGSTLVFTPSATGIVEFTIDGDVGNQSAASTYFLPAYGTGTAPTNGAAATGTTAGNTSVQYATSSSLITCPFSRTVIVTGLAVGTTYWFDMQVKSGTSGQHATINSLTATIRELSY